MILRVLLWLRLCFGPRRRLPPKPPRRTYWDWDGEAYRTLLARARALDDADAHA